MTYAPATILAARAYLKGQDADLSDPELGIVGGPSHIAEGTSYHLGRTQIKMNKNPYSVRTARDKAGLTDAASALDVDDDLDELRALSVWAVEQCRAGAPDTLDIREIIYSPDGVRVLRWDRERGQSSQPIPDNDLSHRTHTHFSYYRDSELRDKVGLFRRFFEGVNNMADLTGFAENANNHGWATTQMLKQYEVRPLNDSGAAPVQVENAFVQLVLRMAIDLAELKARPPVQSAPVDIAALASTLAPLVRTVVREELDNTKLGLA